MGEQPSNAGGSEGTWWCAGCGKCFRVGGRCPIFGFVSKQQCFEFDVGRYRKPLGGVTVGVVGELGKVQNKSYSCILDQLTGTYKQTCQECVTVVEF